jgi:hypothetical protein
MWPERRKPRGSDGAKVKEGGTSDDERVAPTIVEVVYERKARCLSNESQVVRTVRK